MTIRYIDEPSPEELEEVKAWIRANAMDYDDAFDCSVECCHDLGIFDEGQFAVDPTQDRAICQFVGELTESFFSGRWQ